MGILTLEIFRWVEGVTPGPHDGIAFDFPRLTMTARAHSVQKRGNGRITGTVKVNGALTARRVTLFRREDLFVLAQQWSDPETGEYEFTGLVADGYLVVCDDYAQSFNAAVADWVEPEAMG